MAEQLGPIYADLAPGGGGPESMGDMEKLNSGFQRSEHIYFLRKQQPQDFLVMKLQLIQTKMNWP